MAILAGFWVWNGIDMSVNMCEYIVWLCLLVKKKRPTQLFREKYEVLITGSDGAQCPVM